MIDRDVYASPRVTEDDAAGNVVALAPNRTVADVRNVEDRLRGLMIEGLAGNQVSYRRLLVEAGDRLRIYYARRLGSHHASAEDLVQDTLIAVHTRRFTYDVKRPFTAWLHAIARYKMIDHLRASRSSRTVPLDGVEDLVGFDEADATGARLDVERLLDQVPARSRGLIRAVKIEGRSVAEVSAASGLSESAVKVAIHRALKRLSRGLGEKTP